MMPLSARSKLRSQIALTILAILMMVWAMAFYELRRSKQEIIHEAELQTATNAHVFSEYSLSNIKRLNEFILDARASLNGDWKSFAEHVQRRQENINDIAFQVGVIDRHGILAFSNLAPPNERIDLSQREHFRVHADAPGTDRLFISKPLKGKVSGKWSIQFTRPIFLEGRFDGVLVVSVSPELFGNFYDKLDIGRDSILAIIRDSGEFMVRRPVVESIYSQVVKGRAYLEPDSPVSGNLSGAATSDGTERIFGYYKLPEYRLIFVVGKSRAAVLAPYEHFRNMVIGLSLAASSLALFFFLGLNRSLSQLQQVERELKSANQQAESADTASKAKSAFLAHMSHEIRTPLNVIIGVGELLSLDIPSGKQRRKLDQLNATSGHLLALINDILDLSKIEAGQLSLRNADFRLDDVIERVMRLFSDRAQDKGLALKKDLTPSSQGVILHGDALRLSQVLINLMCNAVKFTDRGSVTLSVSLVEHKAESFGLRFSVTDTGCGISTETQAEIFRPFTQGDASTTRKYGGTGLGLAISQHLVNLMGGSIRVSSQQGSGSSFSFEIEMPKAKGPIPSVEPDTEVTRAFSGKRILLVDDHPQSRAILLEMLESFGCHVDTAADGIEAVERARSDRHDLVMMDCQMPRMDGLDATRVIRSLQGHGSTPIVALTADAFAEDRERCLAAGMSAHLGKPVTLAKLAVVLTQWLQTPAAPAQNMPRQGLLIDDELSRALMLISGIEVPAIWCSSPEQLMNYCSLVKRFIGTASDEIRRLKHDLAADNHDAARALAHQIRGFSGFVGAQRVASLIGEIDRGLRTCASPSVIAYLINQCESELARLNDEFNALPMGSLESAPA